MENYKVSTIIYLKKDLSNEELERYRQIIQEAFDNNLGYIRRNDCEDEFKFIFEGEENDSKTDRPCLEIGVFTLKYIEGFLMKVEKWEWLETDPDECCDVLKIFAEDVA